MKLGIMQPYFMPYIGYWQLLNLVDEYVVYDDVNYIKGGWINRNRILLNGEAKYFNVPMLGASPYKKINEIKVNLDRRLQDKNLMKIHMAYKKAPFFEETYPLIESIIKNENDNLSGFVLNSIKEVAKYLGIETKIHLSSELEKDCSLKGQEKVLAICKLLEATEYYNAIGGQDLYSFEDFSKNDITLKFLKTDEISYKQFGGDFIANLSILDVMMFNSVDEIKALLQKFSIVTK